MILTLIEIADVEEDDEHHPHLEKGELYDLTRPLEGDCSIELLKFDDPLAKTVHIAFLFE